MLTTTAQSNLKGLTNPTGLALFVVGGNENEDGELEHIWDEQPVRVSNFTSGTNKLFENDHFSSEAIGSKEPQTPEEMATVFNNVGALLNESFTHAKRLGKDRYRP